VLRHQWLKIIKLQLLSADVMMVYGLITLVKYLPVLQGVNVRSGVIRALYLTLSTLRCTHTLTSLTTSVETLTTTLRDLGVSVERAERAVRCHNALSQSPSPLRAT
jgi:energy-coupling factor transporter transmembrane protein EcfT